MIIESRGFHAGQNARKLCYEVRVGMNFEKEIEILAPLATALKKTKELGEKQEILLSNPKVNSGLRGRSLNSVLLYAHDLSSKIALFSIVAIDQHEMIFSIIKHIFRKRRSVL